MRPPFPPGDPRRDDFFTSRRPPADEPPPDDDQTAPYDPDALSDLIDDADADDRDAGESAEAAEAVIPREQTIIYRGASSDPVFGYLVALALAVGLLPLNPGNVDLRYVIVWLVLAGFGVLAWLLGSTTRIGQEEPENLSWGLVFGLMIGIPLLAVGSSTLTATARLLFSLERDGQLVTLSTGAVLALLVIVQPLAETLFFRGVLQETRPFWLVGLLASLWAGLLFLPLLDIGTYPIPSFTIATALVMMNMMYSYVRLRNGLAAAWLCQIVTNFVVLFMPFVGG